MTIAVNTNFTSDNAYKQKKSCCYGAHIASLGAAFGITSLGTTLVQPFANKLPEITKMPDEQVKIVHKAGETMLKQAGLADKVKIKYYPKKIPKITTLKDMFDAMVNPIKQVEAGVNAFFAPKPLKDFFTKKVMTETNSILLPEKDMATTIFHEIGHAMNWNLSKIGKLRLNTYGVCKALPIYLALYASLSRKSKPDENGKLTTGQKINNFIRNNAGIISLAAFSSVLLEEWKATSNGKKYAKKLLSPELLKKYNKGTMTGFMSYVVVGLFSAIAAHTAVKVKDKVLADKEAKIVYA